MLVCPLPGAGARCWPCREGKIAELVPRLSKSQPGGAEEEQIHWHWSLSSSAERKTGQVARRWEENSGAVMGRMSKFWEWWSVLPPLKFSLMMGVPSGFWCPWALLWRGCSDPLGLAALRLGMNQTPRARSFHLAYSLKSTHSCPRDTEKKTWEQQSTVEDSEPGWKQKESKPDHFTNIIMRYKAVLFCSGRRCVSATQSTSFPGKHPGVNAAIARHRTECLYLLTLDKIQYSLLTQRKMNPELLCLTGDGKVKYLRATKEWDIISF